jgi:predicted small secreted protein
MKISHKDGRVKERMGSMRVMGVMGVVLVAVLVSGCGTQNPFGRDGGESTAEEDAVVIGGYTQTVNSASADTTIAPVLNGNNNTVIIVVGDGNEPESVNQRDVPVGVEEPGAGAGE